MDEITEQEAENYPRKNIITRAISGINPTRIDQKIIENIEPNDFLLLCTDGVLENLNKDKIREWFKKNTNPDKIRSLILDNAKNKTKDNFSMYIVKIKEVNGKGNSSLLSSILPWKW